MKSKFCYAQSQTHPQTFQLPFRHYPLQHPIPMHLIDDEYDGKKLYDRPIYSVTGVDALVPQDITHSELQPISYA